MPICVSQGEATRLIRSTSSGSCSLQQRQLLRQDRHDQQHQRGQRDQRRDLDQHHREQPRHAPRRELLDQRMQRVGEHGADHERRQHRPEQPDAATIATAASADH